MDSGGAGGGLAQGIINAFQIHQQAGLMDLYKQDRDRQAKNDERDAELHQMKVDEFKRFQTANQKVAGLLSGGPSLAQQSNQQTVSDTRAPGLMVASAAPASDVGTQEVQQMPAGMTIAKHALTGNLLEDPSKLTAIANIYAEHGMLDKMLPWLNQAYQAKKSGFVDALPHLLSEDGAGAADALRRAGIPVEGDLTLTDPKTQTWEGIVGGNKRQISAKRVASMANPEKWFEAQREQDKLEAERPEREAKIDLMKSQGKAQEANAAESLADAGLSKERAQAVKEGIGLGDGDEKLPSQAKLAKWLVRIGKAKTEAEAYDQIKTNSSKSPEDYRRSLVQSIMNTGLYSAEEAIKQADQAISAMNPPQGGQQAGSALPAGAKQIGTSKGKPVYEINGKQFMLNAPQPAAPKPAPRTNSAPPETSNQAADASGAGGLASLPRTLQQQQIHQARFNPMDQLRLKELHNEITATNLTPGDRKKLETEIQSIVARHS